MAVRAGLTGRALRKAELQGDMGRLPVHPEATAHHPKVGTEDRLPLTVRQPEGPRPVTAHRLVTARHRKEGTADRRQSMARKVVRPATELRPATERRRATELRPALLAGVHHPDLRDGVGRRTVEEARPSVRQAHLSVRPPTGTGRDRRPRVRPLLAASRWPAVACSSH